MSGPSWLNRAPYNGTAPEPLPSGFLALKQEAVKAIAFADANCDSAPALKVCAAKIRQLIEEAEAHLSNPATSAAPFPKTAQLIEATRGLAILTKAHRRMTPQELQALVGEVFGTEPDYDPFGRTECESSPSGLPIPGAASSATTDPKRDDADSLRSGPDQDGGRAQT